MRVAFGRTRIANEMVSLRRRSVSEGMLQEQLIDDLPPEHLLSPFEHEAASVGADGVTWRGRCARCPVRGQVLGGPGCSSVHESCEVDRLVRGVVLRGIRAKGRFDRRARLVVGVLGGD